ncbi:MAG: TetR/AcrR family transcriptional regulator [Magnetococcales bacterium]|nr:TetR/AcrR family transcriptional regulator [Magnetococcales bacterium]
MSPASKKNPEETRKRLLKAAYEEIYLKGYQAASLSAILKGAGVTKGALYHHFPNKQALGYAVVEEVLQEEFSQSFLRFMFEKDDFVEGFQYALVKGEEIEGEDLVVKGCPLNNLIHEMSPIDEGFRTRLDGVLQWVLTTFTQAIRNAQKKGQVRQDVNAEETALFIFAAMEGCVGLSKNAQSMEIFGRCSKSLAHYVQMLRPS